MQSQADLDRTMVTSIIRLIVLLPALTSMDQTWVIGEGTLWMRVLLFNVQFLANSLRYSIVESNLLVICCCLPTLRRFFRHFAPRLIGEYTHNPSREECNGPKPRTWGSLGLKPKRQFDTLMNTIDDSKDVSSSPSNIPLELRGDRMKLGQCETKIEIGSIKGDDDSEEAILFERSVQVTYDVAQSTHSERSQ